MLTNSVVKVVARDEDGYSCGSGFFVTSDGCIVTAAHVVPNKCKDMYVYANGKIVSAHELARDNRLDVCVIKADVEESVKLEISAKAQLGSQCLALGFSRDGNVPRCYTGTVLQTTGRNGPLFDCMEVSLHVDCGASGAPIVDSKTHIAIGMITWSKRETAGCASPQRIKEFVDAFTREGTVLSGMMCSLKTRLLTVVDVLENDIRKLYHNLHGEIVLHSNIEGIKKRDIVLAVDGYVVDSRHSLESACYHKGDVVTLAVLNYNIRKKTHDTIKAVSVKLQKCDHATPYLGCNSTL